MVRKLLPCKPPRSLSVNLVYHNQHGRLRRREQNTINLIVRIGKSEAQVTNNKRLRSRYCTVKANYIARPLCDSWQFTHPKALRETMRFEPWQRMWKRKKRQPHCVTLVVRREHLRHRIKDFHLTCNMFLHYLVKFENPKMLPNFHTERDN